MKYDKAEWAKYKQNQMKEIRNLIKTSCKNYETSAEKVMELLSYRGKFPNFSINNTILIQAQNRAAKALGDFEYWKNQGYSVKKGEQSVKLIFPKKSRVLKVVGKDGKERMKKLSHATNDEKQAVENGQIKTVEYTEYTTDNVFDITQTNCPENEYYKFIDNHKNENSEKLNDDFNDTFFGLDSSLEILCVGAMLKSSFGFSLSDSQKKLFSDNFESFQKDENFNIVDILKKANKNFISQYQQMQRDLHKAEKVQSEEKSFDNTKTVMQSNQDDENIIERIKYDIPITSVAEKTGFTVKKVGRYYTLKEHDSVIIYPESNSYYQFSKGEGGSNIDFLIKVGGLSTADAIQALKEDLLGVSNTVSMPKKESLKAPEVTKNQEEKGEFILPEPAYDNSRLLAYLIKTRCLDKEIVYDLISNRTKNKSYIYQDKANNVVFVGCDERGSDVFATRRGTISFTKFQCDVKNSNQNVGWAVKNGSDTLVVCEAPIDAISMMCLNKDETSKDYLAICGTGKDQAIYHYLDKNPSIKKVVLALDDDEAGRGADRRIKKKLSEKFSHLAVDFRKPSYGKDINCELIQKKSKSQKKTNIRNTSPQKKMKIPNAVKNSLKEFSI